MHRDDVIERAHSLHLVTWRQPRAAALIPKRHGRKVIPVADIAGLRDTIVCLLRKWEYPGPWAARRAACVSQASRFTWREYARAMTVIYRDVLERAAGSSAVQWHAG